MLRKNHISFSASKGRLLSPLSKKVLLFMVFHVAVTKVTSALSGGLKISATRDVIVTFSNGGGFGINYHLILSVFYLASAAHPSGKAYPIR
jgi:hypothetical protein